MHSGCWVVYSGEDDDLLEERRGNRDVSNGVYIGIQQDCSVELVG